MLHDIVTSKIDSGAIYRRPLEQIVEKLQNWSRDSSSVLITSSSSDELGQEAANLLEAMKEVTF